MVFVPGKPGPTINPDLARDREVVLAEVVASLTDEDLHEVCQTRQIRLIDDGIGFDVDHLDQLSAEIIYTIATRFGWTIIRMPFPYETFEPADIRRRGAEREKRRTRE